MIDKDITINKLEELQREVARIEFSCSFKRETVEAAIKSRIFIEDLINKLANEPNDN